MQVRNKLKLKFGRIDFESSVLDFNCTNYYLQEMGEGLKKKLRSIDRQLSKEGKKTLDHITRQLSK